MKTTVGHSSEALSCNLADFIWFLSVVDEHWEILVTMVIFLTSSVLCAQGGFHFFLKSVKCSLLQSLPFEMQTNLNNLGSQWLIFLICWNVIVKKYQLLKKSSFVMWSFYLKQCLPKHLLHARWYFFLQSLTPTEVKQHGTTGLLHRKLKMQHDIALVHVSLRTCWTVAFL